MFDHDSLGESSAVGVMGVILIIASIIVLIQMVHHKRNFFYPSAQKRIFLLLLTPLVIGWSSWVCLLVGSKIAPIDSLISADRALNIWAFITYIEKMLGWTIENDRAVFSKEKMSQLLMKQVKASFCCCEKFYFTNEARAQSYIKRIKFGAYQYIFVLLCVAIITIILAATRYNSYSIEHGSNGVIWLTIAKSASMGLAMTYTLLFVSFAKRIPEMRYLKLQPKFAVTQFALQLTVIQPLIITLFATEDLIISTDIDSVDNITSWTSNLLLCSEMIIFTFLQFMIYPVSDYNFSLLEKSTGKIEDELHDRQNLDVTS
ncbi:unnamed protein product [Blepharisma stoltei]|uniref:Uncharacterized protein n=1 Tax=Blepharisma stoltei TaxID=1481888 RepID=A0AAU9K9L0_9CILI|nr:unnamed protein product [Blepharisma stoltei]